VFVSPTRRAGFAAEQARVLAHVRRRTVLAAALGAASAYFLDPRQGHSRRRRASDQLRARWRKRRTKAERRSRYQAKRAVGDLLVESGAGRFHPVDDVSVHQHLTSVLARLDLPTSKITVEVADGLVRLRGEVEQAEHAALVTSALSAEPGVIDVESWLHLPGQAPPNKAAALQASARAAASFAPGNPPPS
jgi:hypothetical protein